MKVPLVLLPGTLCTETVFAAQVDALSDVAEPFVLLATEGRDIVGCAAATLRRAPERFALVGFSLGGLVAFEIMRQAPERVVNLCLLSTNPRGSTPQNHETWAGWRQGVLEGGFPTIVRSHTEGVYGGAAVTADVRKVVEEMAFAVGVETFLAQLGLLESRVDSRPSLGTIACPTLLIAGRQDPVTPLELHEETRALIPDAALVPIEACGHYAPLEHPEAVSDLMHDWLRA